MRRWVGPIRPPVARVRVEHVTSGCGGEDRAVVGTCLPSLSFPRGGRFLDRGLAIDRSRERSRRTPRPPATGRRVDFEAWRPAASRRAFSSPPSALRPAMSDRLSRCEVDRLRRCPAAPPAAGNAALDPAHSVTRAAERCGCRFTGLLRRTALGSRSTGSDVSHAHRPAMKRAGKGNRSRNLTFQ